MSQYNNGEQEKQILRQAEPIEQADHSLREWAHQQSGRLPRLDPYRYSCSDTGNGERFAALFEQSVRYCHGWNKWLLWDGKHWVIDESKYSSHLAKVAARNVYHEAGDIKGDTEQDVSRRKALAAWAAKCEAKKQQEAMLSMAESETCLVTKPNKLDLNHWLLNVNNGTIDLKTGKLKPHDRKDLITKLATVDFDQSATCPRFLQFINEIMGGDQELVRFMQSFFGCCLTGDTSEHVLVTCWGQGSNGKSTLLGLFIDLLGDYATQAPHTLLMAERFGAHPTEKTILFGRRLVACLEAPEGRLDERKVKELTGGDAITARRMREDFWSFKPTHKLLLATNPRPEITGQDYAIWRRQQLVPFNIKVPVERQDPELRNKLWSERSGILNWALEGCLLWQKAGKKLPKAKKISESVEAWRDESDLLGPFLEAFCVIEEAAYEESARLYQWFHGWAERQGERVLCKTAFGRRLRDHGFTPIRRKAWRGWQGLRLDETKYVRVGASGDTGDAVGDASPTPKDNNEHQQKQQETMVEQAPKVTRLEPLTSSPLQTTLPVRVNSENASNVSPASPETPNQVVFEYRFFDDNPTSKPVQHKLWQAHSTPSSNF